MQEQRSLATRMSLAWEMAKRDVFARYKGSVIGLAWSFFYPVLMLGVYTFVFGVIFRSRWTVAGQGAGEQPLTSEFALILFSGLVVFGFFSECLNKAPGLVTANAQFVKKVVFPLEMLPISTALSALFHMLVSLVVLLIAMLLLKGSVPVTAVAFPVVVLPLLFATLGCTWLFSALGVYLRDLGQVMPLVTTMLLFLSPVFYPITAVPASFRRVVEMNPITGVMDGVRDTLIFGNWPEPKLLMWQFVVGLLIMLAGLLVFQYVRKGFADVI
ncbi:ABC transporter permease [Stenotrophomonas maltophilia]|uniref:ABC transporter permease n=1 Tax=Stenotrophomonas maltophilia TaxID=40324 RepID=UPI00066D0025|nr:ABC transporter permease [Stenotrophomonas maltophilia]